jgi:hypothetical protein
MDAMAHRNRWFTCLPINSMVIFHGKLLVITRWYFQFCQIPPAFPLGSEKYRQLRRCWMRMCVVKTEILLSGNQINGFFRTIPILNDYKSCQWKILYVTGCYGYMTGIRRDEKCILLAVVKTLIGSAAAFSLVNSRLTEGVHSGFRILRVCFPPLSTG